MKSERKDFKFYFENEIFNFTTDNGVFCKSEVDYGSYLLIKTVYRLQLGKNLLDLGSGYGPIGIVIKHFNPDIEVDAVDVNPRAVELNRLNADNNSTPIEVYLCEDILALNKSYDSILLNPPIRAGKKVIYSLYEKSEVILNNGGCLYIVIQKKQGAESSFNKLKELFSDVKVIAKSKGYQIIQAIK
ncbi:MAG: class I SAM-dependent methyltransferase [Erysipelotrichaceae bacterium]